MSSHLAGILDSQKVILNQFRESVTFSEAYSRSYACWWDRNIFLLPVSCQTYIFEYLKWDIFSYSILLPGKKSKYWAVQFVIEQNQFNTKLDCTMYIWANSITSLFQQEIVRLAAYPLQCRVWGSIRNLSASHAYRGWIICTVLFDHTARPWLS